MPSNCDLKLKQINDSISDYTNQNNVIVQKLTEIKKKILENSQF